MCRAKLSRFCTITRVRCASCRITRSSSLRVVRNRRIFEQQIGESHDRRQRIVHFVRHAGNELAERRHFFRVHQFRLQVGGVGDVRHHHDDAVDVALLVPHRAQADREMPGRCRCREKSGAPDYQPLFLPERSLERFGQHGTPRLRNHFDQRAAQQILLAISGFEAAAVRVADQTHRVEHQNHALRVVQNVAIEIALAAIAALGLAPVGDVFQHVNRAAFFFFVRRECATWKPDRCARRRRVDEFFERRSRVAAKRASPRLRGRRQKSPSCRCPGQPLPSAGILSKIGQRAVQAQDAPVVVVHDDEIRDRVEILDPLLARSLHSRKQAHVFQRHRRVARQRFKQLAFGRGKFAAQIHQTQHAEQLAFAFRRAAPELDRAIPALRQARGPAAS